MSFLDKVIDSFGQTALAGGLAPITARTQAAQNSEENRRAKAAQDLLDNQLTQERITGQQKSNRNSDQDYKTQQGADRVQELNIESAEVKLMEQVVQGLVKREKIAQIAATAAEGGMMEGHYNSENLDDMKAAITQGLVEISMDPTDENISQMMGLLNATRWDFYQQEKERAGKEHKALADEERAAAGEKRAQQDQAFDVNDERRKEELHQNTISEFEKKQTALSPDAEKLKAEINKQIQKETDPTGTTQQETPRSYQQIVEEWQGLGVTGADELAEALLESGAIMSATNRSGDAQGTIDEFNAGEKVPTPDAEGPPAPEQLPSALTLAPRMESPEEQADTDQNALVAEYKEFFGASQSGQVDYSQMSTALQDFLISFAESNGGVIPKPEELEAALESGRGREQ